MNNNTLFLPLKAKWYDMIEKGVKTEEYREIKNYWADRLHSTALQDIAKGEFFKKFDTVTFSFGYTKRRMIFECKGIVEGTGKPEWGAEPEKIYYVIKLGRRLK